MMMMMAWSPSIVSLLAAATAASVAAAVEVIQVGTVTIQLCTPDIVRVQAAAPPTPPAPTPPAPPVAGWTDKYSPELFDNAICSDNSCPQNMGTGGYFAVRQIAAAVDKDRCSDYYPHGQCDPLYYFYSPANHDNTVARNISKPGYAQVADSGGQQIAGYVSTIPHNGLVPLKLWWCEARKDYQVTGTSAGEADVAKWCTKGGTSSPLTPYTLIETLGYAPPATAVESEMQPTVVHAEDSRSYKFEPWLNVRGPRASDNMTKLVVTNAWVDSIPHTINKTDGATVITTSALKVVVSNESDPTVAFFNATSGEPMLAETGREFTSTTAAQSWDSPPTESLYGLGHFNFGQLDFRLAPVDMTQWNLWKIVPYLVSTRGWGLLWDTNYATAHFNKVKDSESVQLSPYAVRPVTAADPAPTRAYNDTTANWSSARGNVTVAQAGTHWVYLQMPTLIWCSHAARVRVGSIVVIDLFDDPCNLPPSTIGRVELQAGMHSVTVETWAQNRFEPTVWIRSNEGYGNQSVWQSNRRAQGIDYYFMAGGSIANSIGLYRTATGRVPMPPRAIFGFMHSKDRFTDQASLTAAAKGFRDGQFPIDTIVQDWFFWPGLQNSYVNYGFDPQRYPDPAAMTKQLHEWNMHFMVTYWPGVDGPLRQELANVTPPALLGNTCDQYNPRGRELYYEYANTTKYAMGVDFSWLDSCDCQPAGPNFLGDGADYAMTYGLMESTAIHDGYVRDWGESRRMFALPRSSYAGMQRTGASMWSGDISGTWDSLRRQVAGSINYQLSGNALWSMDTGGYFHALDELTDVNYRELLVRWHQFAAFSPVLRQHGRKGAQITPAGGSEYYLFGGNTTASIKASHQLRYRILPYLYSVFATQVSGGPQSILQRALVMEFPNDLAVRQTADAFMFGPSFLVFPVLQFQQRTMQCYLPTGGASGKFVDFWSGEPHVEGSTVTVPLLLDHIPVFVKAGSIIPLGPHLQHVAEKPQDPIEVRVYRGGGDISFVLYEDDGATMAYSRKRQSSVIELTWHEDSAELTVSAVNGSFPGMLQSRTFNLVIVGPGHGAGLEPAAPDATGTYTGAEITLKR